MTERGTKSERERGGAEREIWERVNERDREREGEGERDGEEGRESEGVEREGENSWLLMSSHPHRITSRRDRQTSRDRQAETDR